jgi:hypothetical protein
MTRVYPIFTNGKEFVHSSDNYLIGDWRTAYFSKLDLKEWKEKEKPTLTKEMAKRIFDDWNKVKEEKQEKKK